MEPGDGSSLLSGVSTRVDVEVHAEGKTRTVILLSSLGRRGLATTASTGDSQQSHRKSLAKVAAFADADLGELFCSHKCPIEDEDEDETEYVVNCVKHMFPDRIVFQVTITFLFPFLCRFRPCAFI